MIIYKILCAFEITVAEATNTVPPHLDAVLVLSLLMFYHFQQGNDPKVWHHTYMHASRFIDISWYSGAYISTWISKGSETNF